MKRNKTAGLLLLGCLVIAISMLLVYLYANQNNKRLSTTVAEYKHPAIPVVSNQLNLDTEVFVVIDVDTNEILAEKNKDKKIYPASITKLVTALTALNIYPLQERLKVHKYDTGKIMGLVEGDELTVGDLVKAILIHSANDAAYNLASSHRDGIEGFVEEMNKLVSKYVLKNSHFTNFDGIHQENHYSTAFDLAQIGRLAIKNQTIKDTALLIESSVSGNKKIEYKLVTTNELLGKVDEIRGLKTGWTPEAGGCFLGLVDIQGKKIITVVINSNDRFGDTLKIIDWLKTSVKWKDYSADI